MPVVAIVLAVGSALGLAGGYVLQQHVAMEEPPQLRLSFRILVALARRPVWLGGIAVMVGGQLLGAAALGRGTLALLEPIFALNLLFALPLAALWSRTRIGVREWAGGAAIVGGLAAFLGAGDPSGGSTSHLPWPNWVISGGAVVLVTAAFVAMSRGKRPAVQATFLAIAAGTLFGLQDALTQRVMTELGTGTLHTFVSWPVFALVATAVVGLMLGQSAFEAAPIAASLPGMTVAEPVTGIAFGVGVYGEHLRLGTGYLAVELIGFAVMVVGMIVVARSPIVTGETRLVELERDESVKVA